MLKIARTINLKTGNCKKERNKNCAAEKYSSEIKKNHQTAWFNSRSEQAEERHGKIENRATESIQYEKQKEKE